MQDKHYQYNAGSFIINIDSYENEVPSGKFCQTCQGEVTDFHSLMQLMMKMESAMEMADDGPQSFTSMRTFTIPPFLTAKYEETEFSTAGKIATFSVQVMFRMNSTWQGRITWLEGQQSQSFRSALELMMLMNSALVAQ